jgi:hypothetical protein
MVTMETSQNWKKKKKKLLSKSIQQKLFKVWTFNNK